LLTKDLLLTTDNPQKLRQLNRSRILEIILSKGAASRTAISQTTGLSKVTTTAIINGLVDEHVLIEVGKTERSAGRPAALVELHRQAGTVLALDVQPSHAAMLLSGLADKKAQEKILTFSARKTMTKTLLDELQKVAREAPFGVLRHITLSLPAPMSATGLPMEPNSLPELDVPSLLEWSVKNNVSLTLENDVKLAAIAEHAEGSASHLANFALLVERKTGVALGLFLGGRLYRGERGLAGELSLVRWPYREKLLPLEQLPKSQRATALAQLVNGLAVALDLSLLVVHQTLAEAKAFNLVKGLQALVPDGVRVVSSYFSERGPVQGAWLESKRLAQEELLSHAVYAPTRNGALPKQRR
jgi:ROK family